MNQGCGTAPKTWKRALGHEGPQDVASTHEFYQETSGAWHGKRVLRRLQTGSNDRKSLQGQRGKRWLPGGSACGRGKRFGMASREERLRTGASDLERSACGRGQTIWHGFQGGALADGGKRFGTASREERLRTGASEFEWLSGRSACRRGQANWNGFQGGAPADGGKRIGMASREERWRARHLVFRGVQHAPHCP
jgi:hypothetical protein